MNAKAFMLGAALAAIAGTAGAQPPAEPAKDSAPVDVVSLTNSVAGERIKRPAKPAERVRIQAAISAADPRQAYALGGSAQDVLQAMAAAGDAMALRMQGSGTASFVNIGGRTGMTVSSGAGDGNQRVNVVVPPQLENVEPPADAPVLAPPNRAGAAVTTDGQGNTLVRQTIGR